MVYSLSAQFISSDGCQLRLVELEWNMGTDARLRSSAVVGYKRDGRRSMQDAGTDVALPIGSAVCRTVPVSLSDVGYVARNDTRSSTKLRPLGLHEAKIITVWLLAVRFTSERSAGRKENRQV